MTNFRCKVCGYLADFHDTIKYHMVATHVERLGVDKEERD